MMYLIGVAGLLALGAVYVGLGLADRGRDGCGGCALRDLESGCGTTCATEGPRRKGEEDRARR